MAEYKYKTHFNLIAPVNDFDKAQEFLSREDMSQYLRNDLAYDKNQGIDSDWILAIDWVLTSEQDGEIILVTSHELKSHQLKYISNWVKGQNADGLGESFEQQDFAETCETDEWGDIDYNDCMMASFDWDINSYPFKLVSQNESKNRTGIKESKLENSVLVLHFVFDEELLPKDVYSKTKKWLENLDISGWVNNLTVFDPKEIKKAEIILTDPAGFIFKVYTTRDLTKLSPKEMSDLTRAVERYVFTEIAPEYYTKPFGKITKNREMYSRPHLRQIKNESKRPENRKKRAGFDSLMENINSLRKARKQTDRLVESEDPTEANPLKIDAPRGEYWIWKTGSEIYGSAEKPDPYKNIVNARATINFSNQGFEDVNDVINYVKKYF